MRARWFDWVIGALLFAGVWAFACRWSLPGLPFDAWAQVDEALRLRPVADVTPGLWRYVARWVFAKYGLAGGEGALCTMGWMTLGLFAALAYSVFRGVIGLAFRFRLKDKGGRALALRSAAALGAVVFAGSNPVGRLGQAFTTDTLVMLLVLVALWLFFVFLHTGSALVAYGCMALTGALCAETPFGFVLFALVWGIWGFVTNNLTHEDMPVLNAFVEYVSKAKMMIFFAVGLIGAGALNTWFTWGDNLELALTNYLICYGKQILAVMPYLGWISAAAVVVLPLVIACSRFAQATDEEFFLPLKWGALFSGVGLVAFSQMAGFGECWFWQCYPVEGTVRPYLLGAFMLCSGVTLTLALAVFGIERFVRDHARLEKQFFADREEEGEAQAVVRTRYGLHIAWVGLRCVGLVVLLAGFFCCLAPGRQHAAVCEMTAVLRAVMDEFLIEAGDARYVFTDGALDAAIEFQAAAKGRKMQTISLLADACAAEDAAYEAALRNRGIDNPEARLASETGAAALMRFWMRDKIETWTNCAWQAGFAMWTRDGREVPAPSGLVGRAPGKMTEEARLRGVSVAKRLAERIIALREKGGLLAAGPVLNDLLARVQWRISQLTRTRAMCADAQGEVEHAEREKDLADRLDRANPALAQVTRTMELARRSLLRRMTPREGLQMALARADFARGRVYAEKILKTEPDDADANWAAGMFYLQEGFPNRAETHLVACARVRPDEPAVWNNLALVALQQKKYDSAAKLAKKALQMRPESEDIKDTARKIVVAREKHAAGGTGGK